MRAFFGAGLTQMRGQARDRPRQGREAETGDEVPDLGGERRMAGGDGGETATFSILCVTGRPFTYCFPSPQM
jgi:hypothetical protein